MGIFRIPILAGCLVGVFTHAVHAQQASARVYGRGDITVGEHSSCFTAAEGVTQVAPIFTVHGTFARLADATPSFLQDGVHGDSLVTSVPLTVRSPTPAASGIARIAVAGAAQITDRVDTLIWAYGLIPSQTERLQLDTRLKGAE